MNSIVFIHSMDIENQKKWLLQFNKLLPNEQILTPDRFTDEEANKVELAIVANPSIDVLKRFPNLVWVQSLWAGVEGMVDSFRQINSNRSTQLVRLIDPYLTDTMAEAVLTWTLFLHRNIPEYSAQQSKKVWRPIACPSAKDVTVSVLGTGELGSAAMQVLVRQGYVVNSWSRSDKNILGVNHFSGDKGLISLLKQTDILVCLLPLTEQTNKLLDHTTLSYLPKGAKLINFARGGIINHDDLQVLLDDTHLSHAVLDVFEHEPLAENSPLWCHPNISVLPHISATTNLETASQVAAGNILKYRQSGVIPATVDLERGY